MKHKKLVYSALLLGTGIVLPLFTMQIKEIGDSLLPMHFPVLICGFICGWKYASLIGFILPFLRSVLFSMPPIYPNAVWMAFELATYGFVSGFLYDKRKSDTVRWIYFSLITAMLSGRIVWGIVKAMLLGIDGKPFIMASFIAGGFTDAFLGITLQIILIPYIVRIINKKGELK